MKFCVNKYLQHIGLKILGDSMETHILAIKELCLEKWRNGEAELDERLEAFEKDFETWYQQIPENYQSTVITLIKHLEYYPHRTTNSWLKILHNRLLENSDITSEDTIYAFLKSKDGKTNSSNDYWTEYKAMNSLNKNACIENMDILDPEDWEYIKNIVFIDDFSGTGDTFINELEKIQSVIRERIYFSLP